MPVTEGNQEHEESLQSNFETSFNLNKETSPFNLRETSQQTAPFKPIDDRQDSLIQDSMNFEIGTNSPLLKQSTDLYQISIESQQQKERITARKHQARLL